MQRNWFDPWGNPRDTTLADFPITNRGFTGHEHYNFFKIINMNGRLYDPVIGRFFSPDNFVQLPEFTQSFNRYSYCLNNPLTFVDPTGQLFSPYYDHDGKFLGLDEKGWSGNIYITTEDAFKASATGGVANSAIIQKNSATKLISQFGGLSDEALAMIYTSILSETGYADLSKLHNGSISVFNGRGGYNDPISNVGRAEANRAGGRINVTVNSNVKSEFNTVESVQSFLGVHEYKGHGIKGYDGNFRPGNKHYMSYMLQFQDKSFNALSDFHKQQIVERTFHHMFYENRSLYNTYESGNSKLFQLYRMYRGQ